MSLNRACLSYAMARKSAIKWNTFALNAHPYCPGEALLLVVKVVQVVFYVSTSNHTIFEKNLNFSYRY